MGGDGGAAAPATSGKKEEDAKKQSHPPPQPPPPLSGGGGGGDSVGDPCVLGVLTVSDRASRGLYEDLGGPAILRFFEEAIKST
jgi:hypothetical protein